MPEHQKVKSVRIEPHVGGHLVYVEDVSTGAGITAGRITAWEPPRRFSFLDRRDGEVTVTFEAVDGGCRVTVEEGGLDSPPTHLAEQRRRHSGHRQLPEWFTSYTYTAPSDDRFSTELRAVDDAELTAAIQAVVDLAVDSAAAAARGEEPAPRPSVPSQ